MVSCNAFREETNLGFAVETTKNAGKSEGNHRGLFLDYVDDGIVKTLILVT
jgi:hypothetical protein